MTNGKSTLLVRIKVLKIAMTIATPKQPTTITRYVTRKSTGEPVIIGTSIRCSEFLSR